MQPYFLPYYGYFQLIGAVDMFVVYDDIEYTKKGWINRNRMLRDGAAITFTIPLKGGSDYLDVREREVAESFRPGDLLNKFAAAYRKAPEYATTLPLVERVLSTPESNLFQFLEASVREVCRHLAIPTEIRRSSTLKVDPDLKAQSRVLATCEAVGASTYINPIGGVDLYSAPAFQSRGIELRFLRPATFEYQQFQSPFVPQLSIIDPLMFLPLDDVRGVIGTGFELV